MQYLKLFIVLLAIISISHCLDDLIADVGGITATSFDNIVTTDQQGYILIYSNNDENISEIVTVSTEGRADAASNTVKYFDLVPGEDKIIWYESGTSMKILNIPELTVDIAYDFSDIGNTNLQPFIKADKSGVFLVGSSSFYYVDLSGASSTKTVSAEKTFTGVGKCTTELGTVSGYKYLEEDNKIAITGSFLNTSTFVSYGTVCLVDVTDIDNLTFTSGSVEDISDGGSAASSAAKPIIGDLSILYDSNDESKYYLYDLTTGTKQFTYTFGENSDLGLIENAVSRDGKYIGVVSNQYEVYIIDAANKCKFQKAGKVIGSSDNPELYLNGNTVVLTIDQNELHAFTIDDTWSDMDDCTASSATLNASTLVAGESPCEANEFYFAFAEEGQQCVSSCSTISDTLETSGQDCVCGGNEKWNQYSQECVASCDSNNNLQENNGVCECTSTNVWLAVAGRCVDCSQVTGSVNDTSGFCECSGSWNGVDRCLACSDSEAYNPWSQECVATTACPEGAAVSNGMCYCEDGKNWFEKDEECITCSSISGATVVEEECVCSENWVSFNRSCVSDCTSIYGLEQQSDGVCGCQNDKTWNTESEQCEMCTNGQIYDIWGEQCVDSCPEGAEEDENGNCECSANKNWSDLKNMCVDCGSITGAELNLDDECVCASNTSNWFSQNDSCLNSCTEITGVEQKSVGVCGCESGKTWNSQTNQCESCSGEQKFDQWGEQCVNTCPDGSAADQDGICQCENGLFWFEQTEECLDCTTVINGGAVEGGECVCPSSAAKWLELSNSCLADCTSVDGVEEQSVGVCGCESGKQWDTDSCKIPREQNNGNSSQNIIHFSLALLAIILNLL